MTSKDLAELVIKQLRHLLNADDIVSPDSTELEAFFTLVSHDGKEFLITISEQ